MISSYPLEQPQPQRLLHALYSWKQDGAISQDVSIHTVVRSTHTRQAFERQRVPARLQGVVVVVTWSSRQQQQLQQHLPRLLVFSLVLIFFMGSVKKEHPVGLFTNSHCRAIQTTTIVYY
eukprot:PhF_6_TR25628/c0_g1_i3/m.36006